MEETFIASLQESISGILKISLEQAVEIAKTLVDSIGVVGPEDLQLLTEDDLAFLKPLQKRKLLIAWKPTGDANFHVEATYAGSDQPSSSSSSLLSSNWVLDFDPWDKMPDDIMKVLNEGRRISAEQRRDLVRVISDGIRSITVLPGKKAIGIITKGVVTRFPSLADTLCGDIVGDGNCYLFKQIKTRLENLNRGKKSNSKKENSESKEQPSKKQKLSDKYGCSNWQPPIVDSPADVESKRLEMIDMSRINPKNINLEDLRRLIRETYPSQRTDLNCSMIMSEISQKWPMLLTETGLNEHFSELVGVNLAERYEKNKDKLNRVLDYLRTKEKNPEQKEKNPESEENLENLLVLLAKYFSEDIKKLFITAEITVAQEVSTIVDIPLTPCLIAYGGTVCTANSYMLLVDGFIVNSDIKTFVDGFLCLFETYYIFNIQYPAEVGSTLEFIQRCLLNINPVRGQKRKKNIKDGMSPKVLSLVLKVNDHEWF